MSAAASADSTKRIICETSIGEVEILFEERSGVFSAYRFDRHGRPIAAAFENWGFRDLADVLRQDVGMPPAEADEIATVLAERWHVDIKRPAKVERAEETQPSFRPTGLFSALLAGAAALALLFLLWTTLQVFL